MRRNLKAIAEEITEGKLTLDEAEEKYKLTASQKSHVKRWANGSPEALRNKTKQQIAEEMESHLRAFKEMEARKAPRPIKRVVIHGKRYIDITADFIDCGG